MKNKKPEIAAADNDEDSDMATHALLGFDESTSCFQLNKSNGSVNAASLAAQYFRWSPESIKMMLTMRFEMELDFSQRLRQKKDLWNEIAVEMGQQGGFVLTGEVCDLKFRNMLQTFKKNRIKEERGLHELIIWEYYSIFKDAMYCSVEADDGSDQLIPSMMCESVCTEEQLKCNDVNSSIQYCKEQSQQSRDTSVEPMSEEHTTSEETLMAPPPSAEPDVKRGLDYMTIVHVTGGTAAAAPSKGAPTKIAITAARRSKRQRLLSANSQAENETVDVMEKSLLDMERTKSSDQDEMLQSTPYKSTSSSSSAEQQQQQPTLSTERKDVGVGVNLQSELTPPAAGACSGLHYVSPMTAPPAPPPPWLTASEFSECGVFGQSIGLQLANVREPHFRSLLKLKMQELLYKACTGKLSEQ